MAKVAPTRPQHDLGLSFKMIWKPMEDQDFACIGTQETTDGGHVKPSGAISKPFWAQDDATWFEITPRIPFWDTTQNKILIFYWFLNDFEGQTHDISQTL